MAYTGPTGANAGMAAKTPAPAPVSPALASSYTSGTGPASFGVGVPVAAGGLGNSYGTPPAASNLPDPTTPNPYQSYIDQFNSSLATQRGQLDRGLHQALGELSGRRDAAAKVAAGLPSQVASSYNTANANELTAQQALHGALSPDVSGDAAAVFAPYHQALLQDEAGANALGPFVQLAQRANYDSGQAALENTALQGQQGLDQTQSQFLLGLAHDQTQRQQQLQDQQAQWAHDKAWATDPSNPNSIVGQATVRNDANQSALASQPAAGVDSAANLTTADVTKIKSSPQYADASSRIQQLVGPNNKDKGRNAGIATQYITHLAQVNPGLLAVLKGQFPDFFKAAGALPNDTGSTWLTNHLDLSSASNDFGNSSRG